MVIFRNEEIVKNPGAADGASRQRNDNRKIILIKPKAPPNPGETVMRVTSQISP